MHRKYLPEDVRERVSVGEGGCRREHRHRTEQNNMREAERRDTERDRGRDRERAGAAMLT